MLNDIMEFDRVIKVWPDGDVTPVVGMFAPDLFDGELEQIAKDKGWSLMDGYSGQYGYSGPIMHASEFVGGKLERDILATPGYYVVIADYPSNGGEPDGWAVAYKEIDV